MIRGIRAVTAVLLTFAMLLSMPLTALAETMDIEGHWAKAIIESTAERGILKGYPDGSFRPDNPMTQAEFFALVNRSFGFEKTAEAVASSISENAWYAADYKKAKAQGYLELLAAGLIKPEIPISRQMAGAILGKVLKLSPDEAAVNTYGDGSSFASWAKGLCGAVSRNGYMQGYKDRTFRPEANISRAEVAAILYRVLGGLYNTAGVYGNSQSLTKVPGNATVTSSGVTLKNMVIEGNLYLTEGIGDGTVTLEGVTVKGAIIAGGGAGGVFLRDTSAGSIMISNSVSPRVYMAVQGSSTVGVVEVRSSAKLEELDLKGIGFREVVVSAAGPAEAVLSGDFDKVAVTGASGRVSILKGTIALLEANGKDAAIEIDKSVRIMTLNVNKPSQITGNCYIGTANIYSSYVYIEASPVKAFIATGLTEVYCTILAFSTGSSSGGGGGGSHGGGSTTTYTLESVDPIEAITVANGTAKGAIGLPATVMITLNDGRRKTATVAWDNGIPSYDPVKAGIYKFKGILTMPAGVKNTKGLTASVDVTVEEVDVPDGITVTAVQSFSDINVAYGTELTVVEAVYLPEKAIINLSNGSSGYALVNWDGCSPEYDGETAGTYTFNGTLTMPSEEVTNPDGFKGQVKIIVLENDGGGGSGGGNTTYTVESVDPIEAITVANGTAKGAIGLPSTVMITLNDGRRKTAAVAWDNGIPSYDPVKAGIYKFKGILTIPAGVKNTKGLTASVDVTVEEVDVPDGITVTAVQSFSDINVAYGTELTVVEAAYLPDQVVIDLSDGTDLGVPVDWDGGTPAYYGNMEGIYIFAGTLVLPAGVESTNLKASVTVIVAKATVASLEEIDNICVPNGTQLEAVSLPTSVNITLNNGNTVECAVTWDGGTPAYDANKAGTYVFSGTFVLPAYISETDLKASVNVIVKKAVVTSVEPIEDIDVANGTVISAVGLPTTAKVTLNNGYTPEYTVVWDGGTPTYDGNTAGAYVFSGALATTAEVEATSLKASVKVVVADAIVTAVDALPDINVENGKTIGDVSLPATVGISLNNGLTGTADITWDTTGYDPNTAGIYTLYGTLCSFPTGVVNSDGLRAAVKVMVGNATVASVTAIADISVDNGTAASNIDLPVTADVTLGNGTTKGLGVSWDGGTPAYDGYTVGTYIFSGTLDVPAGIDPTAMKASVNVIVKSAIVTSVEPIADINVANGTAITAIGLPATASVTLNNGNKPEYSVVWDGGSPIYDGYKTGTYVFSGTLTIPSGVEATSLKAGVNVMVADALVTGVDALATINVENGTSIDNIPLPETVGISLNNGLKVASGITWDTTGYDGKTAGTYTMYGTLGNLPAGVVNSSGLKAEVRVLVGNATVASVAAIADINVDNGTAVNNIGLPLVAVVTLGNGTTKDLAVAWDGGTPAYDGYTAGIYVFSGTFTIPTGVAATSLKASARVIVADAVITGVNAISDINVSYGTALDAVGLPSKATVVLNNGTSKELNVTWDGGTPTYDGNTAGNYVFSGTLTVPTGIAATDLKAGANVVVAVEGPTGTYTISTINVFAEGMSITVSNLSDANYFNVYRISNNALVNPKPVSVGSMITTLNAVYNDISDLEIWVYSDSAGSNRVAVFTLTGDGTSGTLVLK